MPLPHLTERMGTGEADGVRAQESTHIFRMKSLLLLTFERGSDGLTILKRAKQGWWSLEEAS